ncbi:Transcriptional regulator, DeoR family precursor [Luteococcus japonicus LSP_Lj1]|uniref:Lactose phosphotransferase system repressor n=2 Tax=Luteococcus japonicus TaxID=33984 RepID=A0A1R4KL43_9ACTN|nr:Transcriptional regulator, DeoR family precursor [Luteococcus japonicus LSP_Lj1]
MIIKALGRQPISVEALSELTGASAVTIRRDLTELQGHGLVRRVHGGAVAVDLRGAPLPYELRAAENADGKQSIAHLIGGLVGDDMSIILDNGSTMDVVARALAGRRVTTLCMSLRAAVEMSAEPGPVVITPGGPVQFPSLRSGSAASLAALSDFRADLAVMGACSVNPSQGLTVTTHEDAQIKRAIIAASSRVVLAATGDKLTRTSTFRFGVIEDLDDLVTTSEAPPELLDEFVAAGVRVHVAR